MNELSESGRGQEADVRLVAEHRGASQPVHALKQIVTILGSGDGADLILASSKIDPSHGAIVRLGNAAYLCDLGAPGGIALNGRRLRWARLAHGDEIGIGPFRFRVAMEGPANLAAGEEPVFSLRNELVFGSVSSIDPALVVGSDPGCDVVLRHEAIAPRHCLVVWTEKGPIVRDLQRREKTRLNGHRINSGQLVSGDSIGAGPYELIFETAIPSADRKGDRHTRASSTSDGKSGGAFQIDPSMLVAGSIPSDEESAWEALWSESASPQSQMADKALERPQELKPMALRGVERPHGPKPTARRGLEGPHGLKPTARTGGACETAATFEVIQHECPDATSEEARIEWSTRHHRHDRQEAEAAAVKEEAVVKDPSAKGERQMSSDEPATHTRFEERGRKLDQRVLELRARVAAAQNALDERARKLREGLNKERQHLKACRSELQTQAARLLTVARRDHQAVDRDCESLDAQLAALEGGAAADGGGHGDNGRSRPAASSKADQGVWLGGGAASEGSTNGPEQATLRLRARELADLVERSKEEINRTERRLESLRQDIQRLRGVVTRTQRKHQARDVELEARFAALEEDQETLRQEREELTLRIRGLNAKDTAIQTQMKEAERCRADFEREAELLCKAQEELDDRQHALRVSVESERLRLRAHQVELRRKTAELAEATRERRHLVETRMAEQEAALAQREAELSARKTAVEEASREELEKTTSELEEVLNMGLSQIEAELRARQAELDARSRALFDEGGLTQEEYAGSAGSIATVKITGETPVPQCHSGSPDAFDAASGSIVGSGRRAAGVEACGRAESARKEDGEGRGEALLQEVENLHATLASLAERRRNRAPVSEEARAYTVGAALADRRRRFSGLNVTQLREKIASLRGAPEQAERGEGSHALEPVPHADVLADLVEGEVRLDAP
ncbi:MAG: FHA domain-containing protein [Phycisphaerae bacterium]|nr:FHA domain-containing protein [Phycisphaerae bacterium]